MRSNSKVVFKKNIYIGRTKTEKFYLEIEYQRHSPEDGYFDLHNEPITNPFLTISICGEIKTINEKGFVAGGHVIDSLVPEELIKTDYSIKDLNRIKQIWEIWHNSDLTPGCAHQEPGDDGNYCSYCKYVYGMKWLVEPLPKGVFEKVNSVFDLGLTGNVFDLLTR